MHANSWDPSLRDPICSCFVTIHSHYRQTDSYHPMTTAELCNAIATFCWKWICEQKQHWFRVLLWSWIQFLLCLIRFVSTPALADSAGCLFPTIVRLSETAFNFHSIDFPHCRRNRFHEALTGDILRLVAVLFYHTHSDYYKAQLTPSTRTRQLSCLVGDENRTDDEQRRFSAVLTAFRDSTKEFRNFRLATFLTCRQFCSHRRHGQDKTRQSCLVLSLSTVWTRHNTSFIIASFINLCPYKSTVATALHNVSFLVSVYCDKGRAVTSKIAKCPNF